MARQTLPPAYELWQRHENTYIEVFSLALRALASTPCDISHEDKISEALCPFLNDICFKISKERRCEISTPIWELSIQPINNDELKGGKLGKRPDFTCKLINPTALSPDEHEINFHVECKRLGEPTSEKWHLNKQYIIEGIMRFDSREHGYGKRAFSGLMIGYIVSMSPEQILVEVDSYQKEYCTDNPEIEYRSTMNGVQQYFQKLVRTNVSPKNFGLTHLWVNLIHNTEKYIIGGDIVG